MAMAIIIIDHSPLQIPLFFLHSTAAFDWSFGAEDTLFHVLLQWNGVEMFLMSAYKVQKEAVVQDEFKYYLQHCTSTLPFLILPPLFQMILPLQQLSFISFNLQADTPFR